jgi:hypothetical protein
MWWKWHAETISSAAKAEEQRRATSADGQTQAMHAAWDIAQTTMVRQQETIVLLQSQLSKGLEDELRLRRSLDKKDSELEGMVKINEHLRAQISTLEGDLKRQIERMGVELRDQADRFAHELAEQGRRYTDRINQLEGELRQEKQFHASDCRNQDRGKR